MQQAEAAACEVVSSREHNSDLLEGRKADLAAAQRELAGLGARQAELEQSDREHDEAEHEAVEVLRELEQQHQDSECAAAFLSMPFAAFPHGVDCVL